MFYSFSIYSQMEEVCYAACHINSLDIGSGLGMARRKSRVIKDTDHGKSVMFFRFETAEQVKRKLRKDREADTFPSDM